MSINVKSINPETARISDLLIHIATTHTASHISIAELIHHFRYRSFGFLLIMFCAIPALPVPAQGIATLLSIPVILLAIQLIVGRKEPWIPEWIGKRKLKRETLEMVAEKLSPYLKKFEKITRPRFTYMTSRAGEMLIGICTLVFGISMALPIPLSNTAPSIAIVVMSLGLIERDGLAVKAGICIGLLGLVITTTLYFTGAQALAELWQHFNS